MQIKLSDHFTYGRLLRYTLPTIVMIIFTSLYSVVDGLFVSNLVGDLALSAVNIAFPITMIIGAFGVRIPIAYLVSRIPGATLFQIGLGTPASSTVQIVLCLAMFLYLERRQRREALCGAVTGP